MREELTMFMSQFSRDAQPVCMQLCKIFIEDIPKGIKAKLVSKAKEQRRTKY